MNYQSLLKLLTKLSKNEITPKEVIDSFNNYNSKEMKDAILDYERPFRTGFPEAVFAKGKSVSQLNNIVEQMYKDDKQIIITKMNINQIESLKKYNYYKLNIYEDVGIAIYQNKNKETSGNIAVVTGGTSDFKIAEEASLIAEAMGSKVTRLYDVGIAGLHRLIDKLPVIRKMNVIIAIAGMEGALPSVIAGLVTAPIIAVPTSVGYGVSFNGISALLTMLNSCAPGISVVNIDNGYGAAYQANLINMLIERKKDE